MPKKISDLVDQWLQENPNRKAAWLSRRTGVSKSTIRAILAGRRVTLEVSLRLAGVLPKEEYLPAAFEAHPELKVLAGYLSGYTESRPLQLCASEH